MGCGPGMQTIQLARLTRGTIVAMDNHLPYLETVKKTAERLGVTHRILIVRGDMLAPPFPKSKFDVIWSEGAIYIIGFKKGLQEWGYFIKNGGYLAVSELTWLKPNPPQPVRTFWKKGYPDMKDIPSNLDVIKDKGYDVITTLPLTESAWWDDYYHPLEKRMATLKEKYKSNQTAWIVFEEEQKEIDLYKKYSAYYGYVFYIMRRI